MASLDGENDVPPPDRITSERSAERASAAPGLAELETESLYFSVGILRISGHDLMLLVNSYGSSPVKCLILHTALGVLLLIITALLAYSGYVLLEICLVWGNQEGPIAVTSANPTGEAETTHHNQVYAKLGDQVYAKLGDQVYAKLGDQVYAKLGDQVYAKLGDQVYAKLGDQVLQIFEEVQKRNSHGQMNPGFEADVT
ncbi:hypothetical protein J4Q44_G00309690 [Coregonus suidteri]|uniref:Uncharacterized protein n=1 Tax=Coregonus suidteri TaxID=861788 RepID=A0AAN8KZ34_9TELE